MNSYQVLGLNSDASREEIKLAYRSIAKKLHPDANINLSIQERKSVEEQMKCVNLAYHELIKLSQEDESAKTRQNFSYNTINPEVAVIMYNMVRKFFQQKRINRIYKILMSLDLSLSEKELINQSTRIYLNICSILKENGLSEYNDYGMFDMLLESSLEIYRQAIIKNCKYKAKQRL